MDNSIKRQTPISQVGKKPSVRRPDPPIPVDTEKRLDLDRGTVSRALAGQRDKPPIPICPEASKGRSASIYFDNGSHLEFIKEIQRLHPRVSISSIMCQLLAAFVQCAEGETKNVISMDGVQIKL